MGIEWTGYRNPPSVPRALESSEDAAGSEVLGYEIVALPVVLREGRRGDRASTLVLLQVKLSSLFFTNSPRGSRFTVSIFSAYISA